ncbi:hypothetical protein TRVL_05504 [Trypanosoma vivax]|nr:hypothetical protein TRVL_05504 [Trypanosoma vivax]
MAHAISQRTPRHDAPPYDPSLWEGRDCAFITTLRDVYHRQQRAERQLRMSEQEVKEVLPLPVPAASHVQLLQRPTRWWSRLLALLFPRYYAQTEMTSYVLTTLSTDELVWRMHFALQAGDTNLSAVIAQELARRRVDLYEEGSVGHHRLSRSISPDSGPRVAESRHTTRGLNGNTCTKRGAQSSLFTRAGSSTGRSPESPIVIPSVLLKRPSRDA